MFLKILVKYNVIYYIEIIGLFIYLCVWFLLFDRYKVVKFEFEYMMEMGICKLLNSFWVSLLYVVKKKDGLFWVCGDYRRLNVVIVFDRYFILCI